MTDADPSHPPSPGLIDRVADHLDAFQRRHRLIAFPVAVLKRLGEDRGGEYTAIIAYYGFLSLMPLLLVLVTLLGRLLEGNPEWRQRMLDTVFAGFPVVGDELRTNIHGLQGSGVVLVIGLVFSLWGALGVIQAFQEACNTMWGVPRHRRPDIWHRMGRGLSILVVLGTALVVVTIGTPVLIGLPLPAVATAVTVVGGVVLATVVLLVSFQVLTAESIAWRELLPGALIGAALLTALNALGGLYLSRVVSRAGNLYGTFAVVIGLFVWIALFARLVLTAYEINVVASRRLWPRSTSGRHLGPADVRALHLLVSREVTVADQQITSTVDGVGPGDVPVDPPPAGAIAGDPAEVDSTSGTRPPTGDGRSGRAPDENA